MHPLVPGPRNPSRVIADSERPSPAAAVETRFTNGDEDASRPSFVTGEVRALTPHSGSFGNSWRPPLRFLFVLRERLEFGKI
jgi:hypothetical protein